MSLKFIEHSIMFLQKEKGGRSIENMTEIAFFPISLVLKLFSHSFMVGKIEIVTPSFFMVG